MPSRVLVALRVAAGPQRAFQAFTDEIGQWWRPNGLFSFTPYGSGRLAFEPGAGGRLTETLADGRVFVGWDTVPAEHVARHGFPNMVFLQRHGEWWRVLLDSLNGRLRTADGQL